MTHMNVYYYNGYLPALNSRQSASGFETGYSQRGKHHRAADAQGSASVKGRIGATGSDRCASVCRGAQTGDITEGRVYSRGSDCASACWGGGPERMTEVGPKPEVEHKLESPAVATEPENTPGRAPETAPPVP